MAEYQRYAKDPSYQVETPITRGDAAQAKVQQDISRQQAFYDSNRIVDQQRIENARFAGQNLQALAPFAQSIVKQIEEIEKQSLKDKEIGAQFDSLYNNVAVPEEYEALIVSDQEEQVLAQRANELEAAGKINEAEALRNQSLRVSRGVRNEKALLMDARSRYASDIMQIVNGKELAQLYTADPNAALDIATKIWIKNNNLQYTTKANFVGVLGETIRNTKTYMSQNQTAEVIKQQKEQSLAENDRNAFNATVGMTQDNSSKKFNELSDQYLFDNNGIVTRSAANARAAEYMYKGAIDRGEEWVTLVSNAQIKEGSTDPKTTLGATYPTLASEAVLASRDKKYKAMLDARKAAEVRIADKLKNVRDIKQRREIILEETAGLDPEGQRLIRNRLDDLSETQETFNNYQQRMDQLSQGQIFTPEQVAADVASGKYSQQRGNQIIAQLNSNTQAGQDSVKNTAKTTGVYFNEVFAKKIGATVTPGGVLDIINYKGKVLSKDKVKLITTQFNQALGAQLRNVMYAKLKFDGSQTAAEQQAILNTAAQEFFEKQALSPDGDFYLGGLFKMKDNEAAPNQNYAGVQAAAQQFGISVPNRTPRSGGQQNWATSWNPASGNWNALKGQYRDGDIVWDQLTTQREVDDFRVAGINDPKLVRFAQDMGVTPLSLVNSQARHNKVSELKPLDKTKSHDVMGPSPGSVNSAAYKNETYKAIPALMSAGFTAKGAAYAAALILQAARREGKDLFREEDFVNDLVAELKSNDLFNIFTNPNIKDRALGAAIQAMSSGPNFRVQYSNYSSDASAFLKQFYGQ
jgi:hypothetical protein